jgi:hypothetical protein
MEVDMSSYVLGDPPPDHRFLASLGALPVVLLYNCLVRESKSEEPVSKSSYVLEPSYVLDAFVVCYNVVNVFVYLVHLSDPMMWLRSPPVAGLYLL